MTRPVSVVVPCLDDRELLAQHLPPLCAELARRAVGDELIVVDDSGEDVLRAWLAESCPSARCVVNPENLGFATSLLAGVREARHELCFSMNPDVCVRAGFLDPLVERLEEAEVHAVAPWVLLGGEAAAAESLPRIEWDRGLPFMALRGRWARGEAAREHPDGLPVAFALGGACLLRREEFLSAGGFDSLYAPFYWEDVDHGFAAWRGGRRVLVDARSVVEHHHRGTIGERVPAGLVRAAIEKNRLLFAWKYLEGEDGLAQHLEALRARLLECAALEDREQLTWLALALEQLAEVRAAREALPPAARGFADLEAELTDD